MSHTWVDDVWWRDWLFWVAAVLATVNVAYGLTDDDVPWWGHPLRWSYTFVVAVALLGFVRVVVRTYREPTPTKE
jgi:hypothetical protein